MMGGNEMKEKIKIVLADDNKDFCQVLKEYLSNEDDIEILGIAKDGIEALELVKSKQPDLLVLDVLDWDAAALFKTSSLILFINITKSNGFTI